MGILRTPVAMSGSTTEQLKQRSVRRHGPVRTQAVARLCQGSKAAYGRPRDVLVRLYLAFAPVQAPTAEDALRSRSPSEAAAPATIEQRP